MKYNFFVKNNCGPKIYNLIALLMTIGLFNSTSHAMDSSDPQKKTTPIKISPIQRLEQDLETKHQRACHSTGDWTLSACGDFRMRNGHYIAETVPGYPNVSHPLPWGGCTKCTEERDNVKRYILPLVKDNEELNRDNASLKKKVEELEKQLARVEITKAPETQGKDLGSD